MPEQAGIQCEWFTKRTGQKMWGAWMESNSPVRRRKMFEEATSKRSIVETNEEELQNGQADARFVHERWRHNDVHGAQCRSEAEIDAEAKRRGVVAPSIVSGHTPKPGSSQMPVSVSVSPMVASPSPAPANALGAAPATPVAHNRLAASPPVARASPNPAAAPALGFPPGVPFAALRPPTTWNSPGASGPGATPAAMPAMPATPAAVAGAAGGRGRGLAAAAAALDKPHSSDDKQPAKKKGKAASAAGEKKRSRNCSQPAR